MKVTGKDNPAYDFPEPAHCLADVLDNFDFNIGNIVKACFRLQAAKDGNGKNTEEYEQDKIGYYLERLRGMQGDVSGGAGHSTFAPGGLPGTPEFEADLARMGLQQLRDEEQGEER